MHRYLLLVVCLLAACSKRQEEPPSEAPVITTTAAPVKKTLPQYKIAPNLVAPKVMKSPAPTAAPSASASN